MPGQVVTITGIAGSTNNGYDGTFTPLCRPPARSFTYALATNPGTATLVTAPLAAANALTITSGTLQTSLTAGLLLTNAIVLNNATLNLGGATPNSLVLGGPVALGTAAGTTDTVTVSVPTVFSGIISGAAVSGSLAAVGLTLNKTGTGTLTLSGANSYSGIVTLNSGRAVFVQNSTALGTGPVYVSASASVRVIGNFTLANNFTVIGTGDNGVGALQILPPGVNLNSGNPNSIISNVTTFSGTITLAGNTTFYTNANTNLTLSNTLSGGGVLTKTGGGTLALSGGNTYVGTTNITDGILQITNNAALGNIAAAVSVSSGATLQLNGAGTVVGKNVTLAGTGFGYYGISRPAPLNSVGAANSTWTGNVALTGTLALAGGAAPLFAATNTGTAIGGGIALITTSNNNITAASWAGGIATITGGNAFTAGQVVNVYNITGSISPTGYNGTFTILTATATNFTYALPTNPGTGAVTNESFATIANVLTISGLVTGTDLAKVGLGTLVLTDSNPYTGQTAVLSGTLAIQGVGSSTAAVTVSGTPMTNPNNINGGANVGQVVIAGSGSLILSGNGTLNTTAVAIDQGGVLTLDNTALNTTRFTNATKPTLTFNSGTLNFLANNVANAASAETVGNVILASGLSTINTGYNGALASGATSVVTAGALTRNPGATVNFFNESGSYPIANGQTTAFLNSTPLPGTAANQLTFTNLSTSQAVGAATALQFFGNQGNILPYAEVNGGANTGDFATYTTSGIATFTNYATQTLSGSGTLLNTFGASDIVKVTDSASGTITTNANQSIGALVFNNTGTNANVTLLPSGIFTIAGGSIITLNTGGTASNILGNGTAGNAFSLPVETTLFQNASGGTLPASGTAFAINTIFTGPIIGAGSIVLAGVGAVSFGTTANFYTGGTTLDSGTLLYRNDGNFGTGPLALNSGIFNPAINANPLPSSSALSPQRHRCLYHHLRPLHHQPQ